MNFDIITLIFMGISTSFVVTITILYLYRLRYEKAKRTGKAQAEIIESNHDILNVKRNIVDERELLVPVGKSECSNFELPMDQTTITKTSEERLTSENITLPTISGHVLLVEDVWQNQQVAQTMLNQLGCEVSVAKDGPTALEMVAAQSFDLILTDIQMPSMDGFETTRRLRECPGAANIPIIAFTATSANVKKKCINAGMNGVIRKPLMLLSLYNVLKTYLPLTSSIKGICPNLNVTDGEWSCVLRRADIWGLIPAGANVPVYLSVGDLEIGHVLVYGQNNKTLKFGYSNWKAKE